MPRLRDVVDEIARASRESYGSEHGIYRVYDGNPSKLLAIAGLRDD